MMRSSIIFFSILLVYMTVSHALSQKLEENLSVYEILKQYDFPVGILPEGATSYELDEKTGKFKVYFDGTCIFGIKSYDLKYKSTVKGVISKGKLSKLKGITVKVELLWLKIVEVTRHGDDLRFSVGIAFADFGVDNFLEIPQCGCGFDCNSFHNNGPGALLTLETLNKLLYFRRDDGGAGQGRLASFAIPKCHIVMILLFQH